MKGSKLTSGMIEPYAVALMSIAKDSNIVDQIAGDVDFLLDALRNSEDLQALVANPLINGDLKKSILKQVTEGRVQNVFSNFLMLLVDRRRLFVVEGICQHFQAMMRELRNTILAEVTSTIELNDAQQEQVKQKVKGMTGASSVELATKIDPDLLGGVIIKIGSQVLDASIRGQLRRINASLTSAS
jgi:F-type H+-transporting ATPase subunit delta